MERALFEPHLDLIDILENINPLDIQVDEGDEDIERDENTATHVNLKI